MNYISVELPNKLAKCPQCGVLLDGATCATEEGATPSPGDISVCFYCGALLEYEEDLFLRKISKETLEHLRTTVPNTYDALIEVQNSVLITHIHSSNIHYLD